MEDLARPASPSLWRRRQNGGAAEIDWAKEIHRHSSREGKAGRITHQLAKSDTEGPFTRTRTIRGMEMQIWKVGLQVGMMTVAIEKEASPSWILVRLSCRSVEALELLLRILRTLPCQRLQWRRGLSLTAQQSSGCTFVAVKYLSPRRILSYWREAWVASLRAAHWAHSWTAVSGCWNTRHRARASHTLRLRPELHRT